MCRKVRVFSVFCVVWVGLWVGWVCGGSLVVRYVLVIFIIMLVKGSRCGCVGRCGVGVMVFRGWSSIGSLVRWLVVYRVCVVLWCGVFLFVVGVVLCFLLIMILCNII